MPAFVAAGWALAATLLFLFLASALISLRKSASTDLVSQVACQAAAYVLVLFFILRVHAPDASVRSFLAIRRTHLAFYPLAVLLGAALVVPAAAIADAVTHRFPLHASDGDSLFDVFQAASRPQRIGMIAAAAVLGPLLEEVLFRGALFKPLLRFYASSRTTVIVTTALLFAMVHMEWQRTIHVGIVGLCLGYLRSASGSIVPSMLLHVTFNAIPLWAAIVLAKPGGPEPDVPLPAWLIASCVVGAAALLGLVQLTATRSAAAEHAQELDRA